MTIMARIDGVYICSQEIVARVIEGELIIVPLTAGIGDLEDEIYTLNATGRAVWERLDGHITLQAVVEALAAEYQASPGEIEQDVLGLVSELLRRGMLAEAKDA